MMQRFPRRRWRLGVEDQAIAAPGVAFADLEATFTAYVKNAAFGGRGGSVNSSAMLRGNGKVANAGEDRHDEDTPKGGEPGEEPAGG